MSGIVFRDTLGGWGGGDLPLLRPCRYLKRSNFHRIQFHELANFSGNAQFLHISQDLILRKGSKFAKFLPLKFLLAKIS